MRKFLTSVVAMCVALAAVFSCCMETKAFASLLKPVSSHDCCQKQHKSSSPQSSSCDCHHDVSLAPASGDMAKVVGHALALAVDVWSAPVVWPADRHLALVRFRTGPPDSSSSQLPLYYRYSVLRL